MSVALISSADCGRHDSGWRHPEHVGRLRAITRALAERPELFMALEQVEARHASSGEIALVHEPSYVARVAALAQAGGGALDADTVVSEGSMAAALAAAGSVLDGVDRSLDGRSARSFCPVRPPGHHALAGRGMGFCIFGNAAIGAHYALRHHALERVLVVDWDVHHGNGTQALIEREPGIHFVSMHQWPWYPGTGAREERGVGNVWNVPMPPALQPARYVEALERAVEEATAGWTPEMVIISAGFDCLRGDPLGGFTLEAEHIAQLTRMLVERADTWCGGRVVSTLEGGYDPARLAEAAMAHLEQLLQP